MNVKKILCPQRIRRVPAQFSWVDHRLVREKYIRGCGPEALALYLLLVTVGDAEGLSYYSDATAGRLISLKEPAVACARRELIEAELIAYQRPLYQVLSLDKPEGISPRRGEAVSIDEVLRGLSGGEQ